jgi:WD40 repeat protein
VTSWRSCSAKRCTACVGAIRVILCWRPASAARLAVWRLRRARRDCSASARANSIELYDASIERGNAIVVYHTNILAGRRSHSSMAWRDDNVFAVGQGDADVSVWDVRMPSDQAQAHTLSSHRGVVCGLAFGPDGRLASGGNDGQLNVWDLRRPSEPTVAFEQHRAAAVKAIAWHPDVRNVLASGGGSADRYLRLWDVDARRCFNRRDTRSQVTGLLWSTQHNELISSHGYSEEAALALWTTPDLHRVAQLHSINRRERALYMVGSNCDASSRSPTQCARSVSTRYSSPTSTTRCRTTRTATAMLR